MSKTVKKTGCEEVGWRTPSIDWINCRWLQGALVIAAILFTVGLVGITVYVSKVYLIKKLPRKLFLRSN